MWVPLRRVGIGSLPPDPLTTMPALLSPRSHSLFRPDCSRALSPFPFPLPSRRLSPRVSRPLPLDCMLTSRLRAVLFARVTRVCLPGSCSRAARRRKTRIARSARACWATGQKRSDEACGADTGALDDGHACAQRQREQRPYARADRDGGGRGAVFWYGYDGCLGHAAIRRASARRSSSRRCGASVWWRWQRATSTASC